jgi:glutamate 5-kinase
MKKPLIVVKIGTASITRPQGELDKPVLVDLSRQIARLHDRYRLVLVSSGAVGTGKRFLPNYGGSLAERKAAAAIGNPILMNTYATYFEPYDIAIAQSLCERRHFSDRRHFLQLRDTFETLWEQGIIPIANENDVVSDLELRFSDNDELASLLAVGFGAEALLLGTSVPGVYDQEGNIVERVEKVDAEVMGLAQKKKSDAGLGGMISKLTFARLATRLGIKVVIFGTRTADGILKAIAEETGTLFLPQPSSYSARQKWLASGSLVTGKLEVDEGAWQALQKRRSLLAVGVKGVFGDFEQGEVIEIRKPNGEAFAVARTKWSAQEIQEQKGKQQIEIAHADDIVLL